MAIILITGCGSGFGREMAEEFARRGDEVYAAVRALPAATQATAGAAHLLELDVTSGSSIDAAVGAVLAVAGRIDVLINNAGVHRLGAFEDMPERDLREMMEINFFGPVRLTRAVLPIMRSQRSGHVVMISSVGALVSRAADAYYCASKSALEAAAEALRYEVEPFGIRVSAVEPGAFRTHVAEKGAARLYDLTRSPYEGLLGFRSRQVREACRNGDDPAVGARAGADLVHDGSTLASHALRQPVGAQAQAMVETLRGLDPAQRDAMIRARSRIDWWTRGDEPPSD